MGCPDALHHDFYPRPPRGGRPPPPLCGLVGVKISIHALREEGDCRLQRHADDLQISIHALREEGDGLDHCDDRHPRNFYPRPPRGGRPYLGNCLAEFTKFLSTPSARRATHTAAGTASHRRNFYPRPPRGGRQDDFLPRSPRARISIHVLREEGDPVISVTVGATEKFLSTPSARRATPPPSTSGWCSPDFYPRPPRGGRQQKQRQNLYFQTNYTTFCTNLEEP